MRKIGFVLVSLAALGGCATQHQVPSAKHYIAQISVEPLVDKPGLDDLKKADPATAALLKALSGVDDRQTIYEAFYRIDTGTMANDPSVHDASVADRDAKVKAVANAFIARSNQLCNQYLGSLDGVQRTWKTTFSVLATSLGVAGGIATPKGSAQLLSALGGASSGISGNLDAGIFDKQAGYLVRAATIKMRKDRVDEIQKTMSGRYMSEVYNDVVEYHSRCTVADGLAAITTQVTSSAQQPQLAAGNH